MNSPEVTKPQNPASVDRQLVLSLFSGVGLFDRAFSSAGFCIVTGPELVTGGDIQSWSGIPKRFNGVIGGPPCQGFSVANSKRHDANHPSVVNSRLMLQHTCRVVSECQPDWFLIENVPGVPDVRIAGYQIQRLNVSDMECGGSQLRVRTFQFGHPDGWIIRPERVNDSTRNERKGRKPNAVTTKTGRYVRFPDLCRKQGLNETILLPGWTKQAKFRAVGNGVSLNVGRAVAAAIQCAGPRMQSDCPCGCGRQLAGRQKSATATCRKRLQVDRERVRPVVDLNGYHEP